MEDVCTVAVMVKKSVGAEPFKLMTLNKKTLEPTMKVCAGTTGYEFVSLVSQFLFLRKADKFYFCHYDLKETATEFPLVTIPLPTVGDVAALPTIMGPLSAYQKTADLFVFSTVWGDSLYRYVYKYTLSYTSTRTTVGGLSITPAKLGNFFG